MPFYPYNPKVKLYSDKGYTTIEKKWEEYAKDPTLLKQLFENITKNNDELIAKSKFLTEQRDLLITQRDDFRNRLNQEKAERAIEKTKLEGELNHKTNSFDRLATQINEIQEYQNNIYRLLGHEPNALIKRIEDIQHFLVKSWQAHEIVYNGKTYLIEANNKEQKIWPAGAKYTDLADVITVKEFVDTSDALVHKFKCKINEAEVEMPYGALKPSFYTLEEMVFNMKELEKGVDIIYKQLGIVSPDDLKTQITIDGTERNLKWFKQKFDDINNFTTKITNKTGKTSFAQILAELDNLLKTRTDLTNQSLKLQNAKNDFEAMDRLLSFKDILVERKKTLKNENIKQQILDYFDNIRTSLGWPRASDYIWHVKK